MLKRVWRKGNLLTLLVGMHTGTATMKSSVEIPLKTGNRTAIWPSSPSVIWHTNVTRLERDTCTLMFITPLFTIARTWKQPWRPLADEQIKKLWYIYTMEYYSALKKNEFESVLMRWLKLKPTIQMSVSQKEKHQYSISMHIYGI